MPDGLRDELAAAGFDEPRVLGVEGPGWLLSDFDERWADTAKRNVILDTARALEAVASRDRRLGTSCWAWGGRKSVLP
jgi:hypothetical protein